MDAHLHAALRHAPGHDAAPPAALDARVLAQARAATPTPWWRRLASAVDRLMRPAPAAALASLVMATTIGLMWRGEVPPEALPSAPTEAAAPAPAAAPAAAQTPTPTPATAPASALSTSPAAARAPAARAIVAAKPAAAEAKATADPTPESASRDEAVSPSLAAPVLTPAPALQPTPAQAAAPTPMPAPTTLAGTAERSETRARVAQGPAAAFATRAAIVVDPLANVPQAMATDDARRAAMRELQQVGQGRWQRAPIPAAATADSNTAIDIKDASGRALGTLRLDDSGAWWWAVGGSMWRAELPAPELAAIRARLGKGG